jgi:hypothetical protein
LIYQEYKKFKVSFGDKIRLGIVQEHIIAMDSTSVTLEKSDGNKIIIPPSRFAEENVEFYK